MVDVYLEKIGAAAEKAEEAHATSSWTVLASYSAFHGDCVQENTILLGNLLASAAAGGSPEPLHTAFSCTCNNGQSQLVNGYPAAICTQCVLSPMTSQSIPLHGRCLTSSEIALLACPPSYSTDGFARLPYTPFDASTRPKTGEDAIYLGSVMEHGMPRPSNRYTLSIQDLALNGLIVGLPGSGKSNTTKNILLDCYQAGLPFMVIEAAKKEYWQLYEAGIEDLQVYSAGSTHPAAHPLALNPFEPTPGASLQRHVDRLRDCFLGSFILYSPQNYVLETALREVYESLGWDLSTSKNTRGKTSYPCMVDLYNQIPLTIASMGFTGRMASDIQASLLAKIGTLLAGSKGRILGARHSMPMSQLLEGNVVIELDDLGDVQEKAFITSVLLVLIDGQRRRPSTITAPKVKHLLLIEEAHCILPNIGSAQTGENADPRAKAVESFNNMISELRACGQATFVVDQLPTRLHPHIASNVDIKLCHRLVSQDDRAIMAGNMRMSDEQSSYLSALPTGVLAVYARGDLAPKLVRNPKVDTRFVGMKDCSWADIMDASQPNVIDARDPRYAAPTSFRADVEQRQSFKAEDTGLTRDCINHFLSLRHKFIGVDRPDECRALIHTIRKFYNENTRFTANTEAYRQGLEAFAAVLLIHWKLPQLSEITWSEFFRHCIE